MSADVKHTGERVFGEAHRQLGEILKKCDAEESYREHLFPCSRRSDGRVFWLCEKHTSESLRKKYDLEVVEGRDGRRSSGGEEKERGSSDDDVPVKSSGPRMCVVS